LNLFLELHNFFFPFSLEHFFIQLPCSLFECSPMQPHNIAPLYLLVALEIVSQQRVSVVCGKLAATSYTSNWWLLFCVLRWPETGREMKLIVCYLLLSSD